MNERTITQAMEKLSSSWGQKGRWQEHRKEKKEGKRERRVYR